MNWGIMEIMKNTTQIGNQAETLACKYLESKRYKIVERNYKDRFCEIDIIAADKQYVCLVEVKYRKNNIFGGGFDAIDNNKQKRLIRAFLVWLSNNSEYQEYQPRIDVIVADEAGNIEHLQNAIEAS